LLIELLTYENIDIEYYIKDFDLFIIISTKNINNNTDKVYNDSPIFYKFKSTFSIPQSIVKVVYKLYVDSVNFKHNNEYLPLYLNEIIKPMLENITRFQSLSDSNISDEKFEDELNIEENSYEKFLLLNIENILKVSLDYSFLFNPDELKYANIFINKLDKQDKEAISKFLTRSSIWINKVKLDISDPVLDKLCEYELLHKAFIDMSQVELYTYLYYLTNDDLKILLNDLFKLTKTSKVEKFAITEFFQNNAFFNLTNFLDFEILKNDCNKISQEITIFNRDKGFTKITDNKYMNNFLNTTNYKKVKISKNTFSNKLNMIGNIMIMIETFLNDKSSKLIHSFLKKESDNFQNNRKIKILDLLKKFQMYSLSSGLAKVFDTASRLFFFYSDYKDINSIAREFYGYENFEKFDNYITHKNKGEYLIAIFTDRKSFKLYDNLYQIKNAYLINAMIFNNNELNFNIAKEMFLYFLFLLNERLFKLIFETKEDEELTIDNINEHMIKANIFERINSLEFNATLVNMLLGTKFYFIKENFLSKFEYSTIAAEMLTYFCEAAEKMRNYNFASFCYLFLLLSPYLNKKRGLWWYRLVLTYNKYIKDKITCIKLLNKTLTDEYIKSGFLVKIKQYFKMFEKQKTSKSKKTKEEAEVLQSLKTMEIDSFCEVDEKNFKKVEIQADSVYNQFTGRRVYAVNGEKTTVEILAINYYKEFGYIGVHGENLILPALYNIFLWDAIYYDKVPYVFQSPFQTFPLDLFSNDFYKSRKELIDKRLNEIREYKLTDMIAYIDMIYLSKKNTKTVFVQWNHMYNEKELIIKIAIAIKPNVLAELFLEFSKNLKFMLKGMPDLFLWKEEKGFVVEGNALLVEVKSKNDKLSDHQKYWLDLLNKLNINTEILHIV
jgi:hypothetical protein